MLSGGEFGGSPFVLKLTNRLRELFPALFSVITNTWYPVFGVRLVTIAVVMFPWTTTVSWVVRRGGMKFMYVHMHIHRKGEHRIPKFECIIDFCIKIGSAPINITCTEMLHTIYQK